MKKLMSLAILFSIISTNIGIFNLPAQAAFRSKVEKNSAIEQEKKQDKEIYKRVQKQKNIPYKKLRVTNKYNFINMTWWEGFNDPYLIGYINRAMSHNYDLKMATLTVEEYYQGVKLQMAGELPQVEAGYGIGLAGTPPGLASKGRNTLHGMGIPIIANYEADIFLKNHDKTTSSKKLFEASINDERSAYISIVSSVGAVYYNIVRLDKAITLQEEIVELRKEIYELMALSHANGTVSTSDMIKANKSYINGQTNLVDLKKQRVELLNKLAVLIGESPANIDTFERIAYDNIDYRNNIPNEISSDIIVQRPDYLKAEALLKKAGIDVRVAKKEFLPTINISGLALFNSRHLGSIFTTKNALWSVGGAAMLPIFTGGARIANLKLNKVRLEKALKNYQKINLIAIQEVNDALYIAKSDNEKLNRNKEHLKLETEDFSLTEKKYSEGVISKLDLCQMKENLLTVEKLVSSNTIDCMVDSINLYKAVGAKY